MRVIDVLAHEYGWLDEKILGLTIAKIRSYIDAVNHRRKGEYRRQVTLSEWSTRIIASVTASASGAKENDVAKMTEKIVFPWGDDDETKVVEDPNDLSYLETGDTRAADRNAGKDVGALGMLG